MYRPHGSIDTVIEVEGVAERGSHVDLWLPMVRGGFKAAQAGDIFMECTEKMRLGMRPIVDTVCTCEGSPRGVDFVGSHTVVVDCVAYPRNRGRWFLVHRVKDIPVGCVCCHREWVL